MESSEFSTPNQQRQTTAGVDLNLKMCCLSHHYNSPYYSWRLEDLSRKFYVAVTCICYMSQISAVLSIRVKTGFSINFYNLNILVLEKKSNSS